MSPDTSSSSADGTTSTSAASESTAVDGSSDGATGGVTSDDPSATTDGDGARQQRIDVVALTLDEALTDVPVLVRLGADAEYERMQPDGSDVRFVDDVGTPLPFEIERWNPAGTSDIWVRVPMLVSDASVFFTMQYGDPTVGPPPPSIDVWSHGYLAVWHLTGLANSAAPALAIEPSEFEPPAIEGLAGEALDFDTDQTPLYVGADPLLELVSGLTVEAWVNPSTVAPTDNHRVVMGTATYMLVAVSSADHTPMFRIIDSGNVSRSAVAPDPLVPAQWTYVAGTFGPESGAHVARLFVDGASAMYDDTASASLWVNDQDLTIGGDLFVGALDEARISTIPRSPDWIRVQAMSMKDELLTFATPEPA